MEAQLQHGTVDGCDHLTPTQLYPRFGQTLLDLGPPDGNLAEFVQSESALRILSLGYFASAAAGPCGTALIMVGRERAYASITFVALLGCIAANYLLAQHLGALGAAVATAGVMTLNNALYVTIFLRATAGPDGLPKG